VVGTNASSLDEERTTQKATTETRWLVGWLVVSSSSAYFL